MLCYVKLMLIHLQFDLRDCSFGRVSENPTEIKGLRGRYTSKLGPVPIKIRYSDT